MNQQRKTSSGIAVAAEKRLAQGTVNIRQIEQQKNAEKYNTQVEAEAQGQIEASSPKAKETDDAEVEIPAAKASSKASSTAPAPAIKATAPAIKATAPAIKAIKAPATAAEAQRQVDNKLEIIKNRITSFKNDSQYYNGIDFIILSIVELMNDWPELTSMAGTFSDVRLDASSKISTQFLNIIDDWIGGEREHVRPTLLLGEDTDAECNKARQNARINANSDSPVINYTVGLERGRGSPADGTGMKSVSWNEGEYANMATYVPSGTPKIDQFVKAAKNRWQAADNILGNSVQRGNCGNCWLCSEPVYFYKNNIKNGFTGCGQCEHMGAIIGTIISYMTANLRDNHNSAYGYATSHTWCNQVKTDILPLSFGTDGWILDEVGVQEIAKRIMGIDINSEWNYQEYDPLQWKRIYDWRQQNSNITIDPGLSSYTKIVDSITAGTNLWCEKANENLRSVFLDETHTSYVASEAAGIIQQLTRIITYVIEDTTDRAIVRNVGVWGPSGGSIGNIYPESVSSSEKITDKNIYKDINKKIDEKSDEKSDKKSDLIDLNNIYNRALGVTIKNKEDLIKVIYDVLTKLYENKNGTYVPMFNKLLTNLKNSLIEKNKSNSKNTIENSEKKYDTSIKELKMDNNVYVNPINTNNNVLVESQGGKRNTKKRNTKKRNTKKRNTKKRNTKKRNTRK